MNPSTLFPSAWIFLATLTSGFGQPAITKQPSNQTASLFADATFRLSATGDSPVNYRWRFNDADLIGNTNTTLTITNVQRANAGNYSAVVTNPSGSVTSQVATLTITPFNSIYEFGFSWTDTRGILPDGSKCFWWSDPQEYYQGHACNGPMWPEFLSTNLGLAYVAANNYAYCGATPLDTLNQVINFLAPAKPNLSLYCLWRGTPDVTEHDLTNEVAGSRTLQAAVSILSNSVNRLYIKGARSILIESYGTNALPKDPWDFGTNLTSKASEYFAAYNAASADMLAAYAESKADLRLLSFGWGFRHDEVLANPAQYGFTKTDIDALHDTSLTNTSFTGPGADYVFWDCCHVTSKLPKLIGDWQFEVLTNPIVEKLDTPIISGSPNIQMNHLQIGRDYTLQKSTDLRMWNDVRSFTATAGTNQWPVLGNESQAYFRLNWKK